MANEIVYANSLETGAPQLDTLTSGSLTALLDAVLRTGWRLQTVTSVTVASGVATVVLAGHGYTTKRMVDHAGASEPSINGRKFITVVDASTYTFPAPGVADGVVGGTITAKRSALGWARSFNGTNVSIWTPTDPAATGWQLRVDDSSATYIARARAVRGATDINTWAKTAPTDAQLSGGWYVPKGYNSAGAKQWAVVGDSRTLYLFVEQWSSSSNWTTMQLLAPAIWFGDIGALRAGDPDAAIIIGRSSSINSLTSADYAQPLNSPSVQAASLLCAPFTGVGTPPGAILVGHGYAGGYFGGVGGIWPNPVANTMTVRGAVPVTESSGPYGFPQRGWMRGLAEPLQNCARVELQLAEWDVVQGSSRRWLTVVGGNDGIVRCCYAFDLTGPWD